jgi:hypothetical protein
MGQAFCLFKVSLWKGDQLYKLFDGIACLRVAASANAGAPGELYSVSSYVKSKSGSWKHAHVYENFYAHACT